MLRTLVVLAGLLLAGCTTPHAGKQATWLDRLAPLSGPAGSDVVYMDVAVLERTIGDPYLTGELWDTTDEQVVDLDVRARLDDNGLRVGLLGGILPTEFLTTLTSERDCIDARHIRTRAASPSVLAIGSLLEECTFTLRVDGRDEAITLSQAQFALGVTPELLPDGRVRLTFVPQVAHADQRGWAGVATGAWALQGQTKPVAKYASLSWSVTLGSNEYVVIGTRFDRPDTLGVRSFVSVPPARPAQRVLVVRAGKVASAAGDLGSAGGDGRKVPPLAWQAGYTPGGG